MKLSLMGPKLVVFCWAKGWLLFGVNVKGADGFVLAGWGLIAIGGL